MTESQTETGAVLIVGYDFSDASDIALDQALSFASIVPGCRLYVVWARTGQLSTGDRGRVPTEEAGTLLAARVAQRISQLQNLGVSFPASRVTARVLEGRPAQAINELAFVEGAHMIIVGSRPKSGLERVVLGSVAADVLANAPCPVLVARPRTVEGLPEVEPSHEDAGTEAAKVTAHRVVKSDARPHLQQSRRPGENGVGFSLLFPM
jgi:nucleotide-binding universal stress UspA family protein